MLVLVEVPADVEGFAGELVTAPATCRSVEAKPLTVVTFGARFSVSAIRVRVPLPATGVMGASDPVVGAATPPKVRLFPPNVEDPAFSLLITVPSKVSEPIVGAPPATPRLTGARRSMLP